MSLPTFRTPINVTPRLLSDLPADNPGIASLLRALDECSSIARELGISREVSLGDELLSEIAKERDIREHGNGALLGADKILAAALEKADRNIDKLEGELIKALPALEEGNHGAEVRAHTKSLPERKRREFVLNAHSTGDAGTVAAVLNAPSFLSGLTDADLAVVRDRRNDVAAKRNPKIARELETLKTARGRVELARQSLNAERQRAFGSGSTSAAA